MTIEDEIREEINNQMIGCSGEYSEGYENGMLCGAKFAIKAMIEKTRKFLKENIDDDVLVKCGSVIKCMDVEEFSEYFCKNIEKLN